MNFLQKSLFLLVASLKLLSAQDTLVNPFDLFAHPRKETLNPAPYLWNEIDTLPGFSYELGQLGKPYLRFRYAVPTNFLFINTFQDLENRNENIFWWKPENLPFFDTKKPLTYVCFNQSANETQILDALFSQSVNENANLTLRYKRRTAVGSYLKSSTDHYNLDARFYLKLLKSKIRLGAIWTFNQQIDEMNGGADSLSLKSQDFFNEKAQPVALQNAKLLRKGTYITLPFSYQISPNLQLNYSFQKLWYQKTFTDKGTYQNISTPYFPYPTPIDSLANFTFGTLWKNSAHNANLQWKFRNFGTRIAVKREEQKLNSNYLPFKKILVNSFAGKLFRNGNKWKFFAEAQVNTYDIYPKQEVFLHPEIAYTPTDSLRFSVKYEYHKRIPPYERLTSFPQQNLFSYLYFPYPTLNLEMQTHIEELKLSFTRFSFSVFNSQFTGPDPRISWLQTLGGEIKVKKLRLFKQFFLTAQTLLQFPYDGVFQNEKTQPNLFLKGMFYWQDSIFQAGVLTLGIDNYYYSSYKAPYFNPVNQGFYIPSFTMEVSAYWRADFLASLQIKRFTGFIRILHLNEGWLGGKYFLVAGYPMWHRSFNFGMEWFLFN